jgi:hypothetical protein
VFTVLRYRIKYYLRYYLKLGWVLPALGLVLIAALVLPWLPTFAPIRDAMTLRYLEAEGALPSRNDSAWRRKLMRVGVQRTKPLAARRHRQRHSGRPLRPKLIAKPLQLRHSDAPLMRRPAARPPPPRNSDELRKPR